MAFKSFDAVVKDQPSASSVHVDTALGNEDDKKKKPVKKSGWQFTADILKTAPDQQMVYGWASVIEENGRTITDSQDDQIVLAELTKAAHDFMLYFREGGNMHAEMGVGKVVESLVLTKDLQKALGIDLKKVGWLIGMKVSDAAVWKRIKDGELRAFSVGGTAARVPV